MISANSGIKAESATGSGVLRLKAGYIIKRKKGGIP